MKVIVIFCPFFISLSLSLSLFSLRSTTLIQKQFFRESEARYLFFNLPESFTNYFTLSSQTLHEKERSRRSLKFVREGKRQEWFGRCWRFKDRHYYCLNQQAMKGKWCWIKESKERCDKRKKGEQNCNFFFWSRQK